MLVLACSDGLLRIEPTEAMAGAPVATLVLVVVKRVLGLLGPDVLDRFLFAEVDSFSNVAEPLDRAGLGFPHNDEDGPGSHHTSPHSSATRPRYRLLHS